jgi:hypothetical protein
MVFQSFQKAKYGDYYCPSCVFFDSQNDGGDAEKQSKKEVADNVQDASSLDLAMYLRYGVVMEADNFTLMILFKWV